MATTTNYGWTTPDDTALVKDGAAAIRTLGSSVDTTTKALNPSTTLGDIEYRSSTANTNTRLGIGTTGQALIVSGGVPAWGTVAGWNPNYVLLNTGGTSLTGASVTISGISGINSLYIYFTGLSTTGIHDLHLRLNADTGNNYNTVYWGNNTSPNFSVSAARYLFGKTGDATYTHTGFIAIEGTNATGLKPIQSLEVTGNGGFSYAAQGSYVGTSTISSITVLPSAGTFDAGTIFVYGA